MGGRGTSAKPTGRTAHFSANRGSSIQARWTDPGNRDRKSTRLNSSHGYISYAVFCLKKTIPWFKKALAAARYESYCFPHFNLGRVYEQKREWGKAREHYLHALQLNGQYVLAYRALKS